MGGETVSPERLAPGKLIGIRSGRPLSLIAG